MYNNKHAPILYHNTIPVMCMYGQVKAWPGYRFSIAVAGLNEFGHETLFTARFFFQVLMIQLP